MAFEQYSCFQARSSTRTEHLRHPGKRASRSDLRGGATLAQGDNVRFSSLPLFDHEDMLAPACSDSLRLKEDTESFREIACVLLLGRLPEVSTLAGSLRRLQNLDRHQIWISFWFV